MVPLRLKREGMIRRFQLSKTKKALALKQQSQQVEIVNMSVASVVDLLLSYDTISAWEAEQEVVLAWRKKNPRQRMVICSINKKLPQSYQDNSQGIVFVGKNDFTFGGKLKRERLELLQARPVDILIDGNLNPKRQNLLLSTLIDAKLFVGRAAHWSEYYHVTVSVPAQNSLWSFLSDVENSLDKLA